MTTPLSSARLSLAPSVCFRPGDEGCGFLFDTATGAGFVLNPSAGVLAQALVAGATREQLTDSLVSAFEVEADAARRDVADFLKALADSSVSLAPHD